MSSPIVYCLPLFVSLMITALLGLLAWRRQAPGTRAFACLMAAVSVWTLSNIMSLLSQTLPELLLWDRISYCGMHAAPLAWLVFTGQYAGNGRWLTTRMVAALASLSALSIAVLWTNDWHHLFYVAMRVQPDGAMTLLLTQQGPAFWATMVYMFMLLALGVALLLQTCLRSSSHFRRQFFSVICAALIAGLSSLIDVNRLTILSYYLDLVPLTFPLVGLILFRAMTHYKFLDVAPIARYVVFEGLMDGVIVLDANARAVDINQPALQIIGKPDTQCIGVSLAQLWPAGTELPAEAPDRQDVQREFATPDGRWYDVRMSPLLNWRDEPMGHVVVLRDITRLKRAEAERAALEEQLRHAQKMEAIGLLAGGIAHDFNNLLTPIIGYADLAMLQAEPTDPLVRHLRDIRDAARRASGLTKQLTAFSKKQVLSLQVISLERVILEFLPMLQSLAGKTITLTTELATDAGQVKADPTQVQQVLMNLVLNARDAMPQGGEVCIALADVMLEPDGEGGPGEPGPYVMLTVRDTGIGMDAATQEQIFDPFFTTKARDKGTGLGLAVVFGIVQQHRGRISVDSAPGRGATMRIFLPRVDAPMETTLPAPVPQASHQATVLIVDDEEQVRALAAEILRTRGFDVLLAADGEEALAIAAAHTAPIDLLLTDVVMPRMNGNALSYRLAEQRPGIATLFMSGYSDEILAQAEIDQHTTYFLPKPFTVHTLLEKIDAALHIARA